MNSLKDLPIMYFEMEEKEGFVYILGSESLVLYIGVTSDLEKRIYEHKNKLVDGFTKKYNVHRLLYYEGQGSMYEAICREKQLKGWKRSKKIALIKKSNPYYKDLSLDWYLDCANKD